MLRRIPLITPSSRRDALQHLKSELQKLELTAREKEKYLRSCEQAIVKHKKDTERYKIEMQQAELVVDELQDALDADAIEEGRLEVLKQHLAEAKEDLLTHEASYGESIVAKDKNNESMRNTRDGMAKIDLEIEEAEAKVSKAEGKATKCANQRSAALRDKNSAIDAAEKEKCERAIYEKEREAQVADVESFTMQATEHCARVPVDDGETAESIERKWEKLEKDLKAAEKR